MDRLKGPAQHMGDTRSKRELEVLAGLQASVRQPVYLSPKHLESSVLGAGGCKLFSALLAEGQRTGYLTTLPQIPHR